MINYSHKVNLNGVFKEFICSHCGKTIVMPIGFHIKDYTYRLKVPKSNVEKWKVFDGFIYFCSWSCYKKGKAAILNSRKRLQEEDQNWLKWAKEA